MYCLLCNYFYSEDMQRCSDCNHSLKVIKPYSPHLSQLINLGEGVCAGRISPKLLEIAIDNLVVYLDRAEDNYFELEEQYQPEEKLILEDYLNNILEHAEFLRTSIEELKKAANILDFKNIYSSLDKAKISETMLMNATNKLAALTEEDINNIALEKGIKQKKALKD